MAASASGHSDHLAEQDSSEILARIAQTALKRMQQAQGLQLIQADTASDAEGQGLQLHVNAVGTAADARELAVASFLRLPPFLLEETVQLILEDFRTCADAAQATALTGLFASSLQVSIAHLLSSIALCPHGLIRLFKALFFATALVSKA